VARVICAAKPASVAGRFTPRQTSSLRTKKRWWPQLPTPYIVQSYNRSLEVSDYQLENGALKLAREATSRAGSMVWGLNDLFDTIKEASDKDAILEALEDYRDYSWERDLKTAAATIAEAAAERFRVSADNLADAA
jgi:hypothetical protein